MRSSLACKHAKPFGSTRPSSVASSVACKQLHHSNPHRWACRAEPSEQGQSAAGGGAALNEDMLAQLRKAQEEAARLKKELAELQENKVGAAVCGYCVDHHTHVPAPVCVHARMDECSEVNVASVYIV